MLKVLGPSPPLSLARPSASQTSLATNQGSPSRKAGFYALGRFWRAALPPFEPAFTASERSHENVRLAGSTDWPPLRPAFVASSGFWKKLRFSRGTLFPPLLAISRCFSGLMLANPRLAFLVSSIAARKSYRAASP